MNEVRVFDPRLDDEPADGDLLPLVRLVDEDDGRVRLDSWILDEDLAWLRVDGAHWKGVFARAKAEAFVPGTGVHARNDWNGKLRKRDEVDMFWKRLVWRGQLPVGDEPDPWSMGRGPTGAAGRYWAPRTHVRWLRALRFLIRREDHVVRAGARRTLDDYPLHVRVGLKLAIRLMTKDLDFVDNVRFAETGKPGEMRRYKRAKASGCCGSTDRYVIIGTKQYVVGCNYGH